MSEEPIRCEIGLRTLWLVEADKDAQYAAVIEIDLNEIKEPILACPNDPDDVKTLSEIHEAGLRTEIDEVFVGSCMTNIGLFRALGEVLRGEGAVPTKLWVCPPTKWMSELSLRRGTTPYLEVPEREPNSLVVPSVWGNQAQVGQGAWVFSTSTPKFDNRLGKDSKVYLWVGRSWQLWVGT